MVRIATDVVLLPDETMTERAIEVNKRLVGDRREEIVLNGETHLPHISLAMGCVDEKEVDTIGELLQGLSEKTAVNRLSVVGILTPTNSRGEKTSLLEVGKTDEMQMLHERIMKETKPFFSHDVTDAMIYDDVVAATTLEWIHDYPQKASFERFSPHITIGYGELEPGLSFPIQFRVTRLALCHLGNHCTCRKILAATSL